MQQPQTDRQGCNDAVFPNPMYESGADTTPMEEPQTDWQARGDVAADVPDQIYESVPDATPMEQDPNPLYAPGKEAASKQRKKNVRRCVRLWQIFSPVVVVGIAILLSYFSGQFSLLASKL
ncbi:uncharacterized protein LOC144872254 [Branchiostoma floridae x Branchiostoma japonicum]